MDYETYCEIKRLHRQERLTPGQIAAHIGKDETTVRRWLNKDKFEKTIWKKRESSLDPYRETIETLLKRHPYTAAQIYRMIKDEGYKGGASTVRHYITRVRPPRKTAYLTLRFSPGEAAQVDFGSCGTIEVGDIRRKLYIFVMTLCYSRMMYAEFILRQNEEHFLQCHRNAFEYFHGVPERIIVDNCKVAVISRNALGGAVINRFYADLAAHYGFEVTACGIRKPHEKGRVERSIGYIKKNFLNGQELRGMDTARIALRYWLDREANRRIHGLLKKRPSDLFEQEKNRLSPLPVHPFDCGMLKNVKSNSQFRVAFESNRYSVPAEFASSSLQMKIYPRKLLFYSDGKLIAEHPRSYERNRDFENPDHVSELLAELRNAKNQRLLKDFLTFSSGAEDYYQGLKDKRLNAMHHVRKIMALVDIYGKEAVARAVEDALHFRAFSSEYITNILEQKKRRLPQAAPLHLTRKQDCLDLDFKKADISVYNNIKS